MSATRQNLPRCGRWRRHSAAWQRKAERKARTGQERYGKGGTNGPYCAFRPHTPGPGMFEKSKQRQRDLFESERNFRLLVEGVADCALYMLDPAGIVTSWNIGGQRIKGYRPEEIVGRHFSRFYTEADRANGKPFRALSIAREQGRYEEEGWRVRKDGTFFWASVVIDPIWENGRLAGFAKITRDITERRDAQLKLEQMQKQLAESQKRDVLDTGVGGTVRLEFEIDRDVCPVVVDVAEFETALINLVVNARDAMPEGGTITVAAHNLASSGVSDGGEYVAISVRDTGTGI